MSRGLLLKGQSLFIKLVHMLVRLVRMSFDILDSNGKANIHPGPDISWNHFGSVEDVPGPDISVDDPDIT